MVLFVFSPEVDEGVVKPQKSFCELCVATPGWGNGVVEDVVEVES